MNPRISNSVARLGMPGVLTIRMAHGLRLAECSDQAVPAQVARVERG